ncbi:unnamed protein product [Lactuca saligna]|uniref:Ubiquitin-like protease family profile domain-containing protein n=1 Tax=Lactuca saligna TaxID=75948 RepID=A0AA35VBP0_LACSI|nr:unnamed protein product [Lactuca saligna]
MKSLPHGNIVHRLSSPQRKKYNSETSSTESTTNASSSQQPEVERTYMPSDTSTKSIKKKKTSTKALVNHLLGVVSDLSRPYYGDISTHGLEGEVGRTPTHVEPSPNVGGHHKKAVTPIVRPQRKRSVAWYQRTSFTVMQSTPKLKKITKTREKAVESPEKANEDIVNEKSNDVSNHLLLDSLHVLFPINVIGVHWFLVVLHLNIWKVHIYDLALSMNFFSKYLIGGEFNSFGDSIISELEVIEYWNDFPDGHKDNAIVEFVDTIDAPQ